MNKRICQNVYGLREKFHLHQYRKLTVLEKILEKCNTHFNCREAMKTNNKTVQVQDADNH